MGGVSGVSSLQKARSEISLSSSVHFLEQDVRRERGTGTAEGLARVGVRSTVEGVEHVQEEVDKVLDEIKNVLARGGGNNLSRSLLLADVSAAVPAGEYRAPTSLARTPRSRRSATPRLFSQPDRSGGLLGGSAALVSPSGAGSASFDMAKYLARTGS